MKSMIGQKYLLLFITILLLGTQFSCKSTTVTDKSDSTPGWTEAIGIGAIQGNLIGKAKDDALEDAKRNAVKQALGELLSARTDVSNGELVQSEIGSRSEGYIQTYKLLSAQKVSADEYQVKISAKVNRAKMLETIAEIINRKGRPRTMVLIQENLPEKGLSQDQTIGGTEIESVLSKQGFPMVDRTVIMALLKKERSKIRQALGGNNNAAKELGALAGAEVVILGESQIKNGGMLPGTDMYSVQSVIRIRAIDVNTGEILSAEQGNSAYPHVNVQSGSVMAIRRVVAKIIPDFTKSILNKWDPNKPQPITILITGLDYAGIMKLRSEMIDKVRGVKDVIRRGTAGRAAKLEVMFIGKSFELVDRMVLAGLSFNLKVDEVKPSAVYLQITPK